MFSGVCQGFEEDLQRYLRFTLLFASPLQCATWPIVFQSDRNAIYEFFPGKNLPSKTNCKYTMGFIPPRDLLQLMMRTSVAMKAQGEQSKAGLKHNHNSENTVGAVLHTSLPVGSKKWVHTLFCCVCTLQNDENHGIEQSKVNGLWLHVWHCESSKDSANLSCARYQFGRHVVFSAQHVIGYHKVV